MKSTMLLAVALFLISAPAPDANDIAEITSNFIVPKQFPGLGAYDSSPLASESSTTRTQLTEIATMRAGEVGPATKLAASPEVTVQSIKNNLLNRPASSG